MATDFQNEPELLNGWGRRLRQVRLSMNQTQAQFGELGGVGRHTQLAYEAESTAPDLRYLSQLQKVGVQIGPILYGEQFRESLAVPDWDLLQHVHDHVSKLFDKVARGASEAERWKMVAQMYVSMKSTATRSAGATSTKARAGAPPR